MVAAAVAAQFGNNTHEGNMIALRLLGQQRTIHAQADLHSRSVHIKSITIQNVDDRIS